MSVYSWGIEISRRLDKQPWGIHNLFIDLAITFLVIVLFYQLIIKKYYATVWQEPTVVVMVVVAVFAVGTDASMKETIAALDSEKGSSNI